MDEEQQVLESWDPQSITVRLETLAMSMSLIVDRAATLQEEICCMAEMARELYLAEEPRQ